MFSSMSETGRMKSRSNMFTTLAIIPVQIVSAEFSKSVSWMSIGRNSTRQPMLVSSVGGFLNLKLFQFVDCKFSKCELPSMGGHLRNQAVQMPSRCSSSQRPRNDEFEVTSSRFDERYSPLLDKFLTSSPGLEVASVAAAARRLLLDKNFGAFTGVRPALAPLTLPGEVDCSSFSKICSAYSLLQHGKATSFS